MFVIIRLVLLLPAAILLVLLGCSVGRAGTDLRSSSDDRDNARWKEALDDFPGRYAGLEAEELARVKSLESEYREVMDALTANDGREGDHGAHHQLKRDREPVLWKILESLPVYPGLSHLILAAIDDVYLGYHGNGYWGRHWHWPYLDCSKAVSLADRLAREDVSALEEALWTEIYCYRIMGWRDTKRYMNDEGREPQFTWSANPERVRWLCRELLRRFPNGKYAKRAASLLGQEDLLLELPVVPVAGRIRLGSKARSLTVVPHTGPEFVIDRSSP